MKNVCRKTLPARTNSACRGFKIRMSLKMNLNQSQALDQWAVWFKKEFAPADLDADGVLAYMHHFADLGIFESVADENRWKLAELGFVSNDETIRERVLERLETLSQTPSGFAVSCFLGRRPKISKAKNEISQSPSAKRPAPKIKGKNPNLAIASDLSNLQIVKKVGRQLEPFLEFEKETVSRLQGTHTPSKEARVIFNYFLRHTRTKAEPKKWEQLSRKRHK